MFAIFSFCVIRHNDICRFRKEMTQYFPKAVDFGNLSISASLILDKTNKIHTNSECHSENVWIYDKIMENRKAVCTVGKAIRCAYFRNFKIQAMISRRRALRSGSSPVMASRNAWAALACEWAGLFWMANASVQA